MKPLFDILNFAVINMLQQSCTWSPTTLAFTLSVSQYGEQCDVTSLIPESVVMRRDVKIHFAKEPVRTTLVVCTLRKVMAMHRQDANGWSMRCHRHVLNREGRLQRKIPKLETSYVTEMRGLQCETRSLPSSLVAGWPDRYPSLPCW